MRRIALIIFLTVYSVGSYAQQRIDYDDLKIDRQIGKTFYTDTIKVDDNNVPVSGDQYYFPKEMFPYILYYYAKESPGKDMVKKQYDDFVMKWYSMQLYAMKEPLLFNKKSDKEVFRFTLLRTFDKPVVIRIEKDRENYSLFWKVCSGEGGYDPGEIEVNECRNIEKQEWDIFQQKLHDLDFWNRNIGRQIGLGHDGSEWILEGAEPSRYRVITEWTPMKGYFSEACMYLLKLTGLVIEEY